MTGNSDSDWRKMMRVISGSVGRDILKETAEQKKEEYKVDRTLLSVRDWKTEFEFRNIINQPELGVLGRRVLEVAYARFRQQQMTTFIQTNQDSLSTWAVLDQTNQEEQVGGYKAIMNFLWHFKYDLGPTMQGKLIEIIGQMRTGKNNFLVWLSRGAMSSKIHVITSFPMFFHTAQDGILKEHYKEAHKLSDAMLHMIRTRYKDPDAIFFLVLDEQTTRGASKMRSNSTEAEWANGWIVRSGHFGCTTFRIMQDGEDTIKMQKNLRYAEIYKNVRAINRADGKILGDGGDWPIVLTGIPDMSRYFNTSSPGSWTWDVDPQAVNDHMASHESEAGGDTTKIYQLYERYLSTYQQTGDTRWFEHKEYEHLDKSPEENKADEEAEAAAKAREEEERKTQEPLPLHHLDCPKVGGGLMWTWTPKRKYQEGERVMCPKCHEHTKAHYTE